MQRYLLISLSDLQNPETLIVRSTNRNNRKAVGTAELQSSATNLQAAATVAVMYPGASIASIDWPDSCDHRVVMHPADEVRVNSAIRLRALIIRNNGIDKAARIEMTRFDKPVGQVFTERFWFDAHNTLTIESISQ
jgi:hypothetical protein